jgi:hypothetical protein
VLIGTALPKSCKIVKKVFDLTAGPTVTALVFGDEELLREQGADKNRRQAHFLQQLRRSLNVYGFHRRQQCSSGGFGIGLGVVMVKIMADVRRQCLEIVGWQVRPNPLGDAICAKVIKLRTPQTEMVQAVRNIISVPCRRRWDR